MAKLKKLAALANITKLYKAAEAQHKGHSAAFFVCPWQKRFAMGARGVQQELGAAANAAGGSAQKN